MSVQSPVENIFLILRRQRDFCITGEVNLVNYICNLIITRPKTHIHLKYNINYNDGVVFQVCKLTSEHNKNDM